MTTSSIDGNAEPARLDANSRSAVGTRWTCGFRGDRRSRIAQRRRGRPRTGASARMLAATSASRLAARARRAATRVSQRDAPARTREKARGSCGGPTVAEWGATASHRDPSRARASKSDASRRGIARSDEGKEPANEEVQREVECRGPGARIVADGRVLGGGCSGAGRLGEPPAFRGRGRRPRRLANGAAAGVPTQAPARPLRPPRPRSPGFALVTGQRHQPGPAALSLGSLGLAGQGTLTPPPRRCSCLAPAGRRASGARPRARSTPGAASRSRRRSNVGA